jgi:MFS family permease
VVAPIAGVLAGRIGSRPLMSLGLAFQAFALGWLAVFSTPDVAYGLLVPGLAAGGIGMGLVFAPSAHAVLASVPVADAGKASGATNTIREVGGALGVSVLATVFSGSGGYATPQSFVDGLVPALWVGAAVLVVGSLVGLAVPRLRAAPAQPLEPLPEPVGAIA